MPRDSAFEVIYPQKIKLSTMQIRKRNNRLFGCLVLNELTVS
jgi:hypothetical protein